MIDLSLLNTVTQTVGLTVFFASITAAAILVYLNKDNRINLRVPVLSSAPYALVVIGAGFLTLGVAGIDGMAIALGAGIFMPAVQRVLSRYLKDQT